MRRKLAIMTGLLGCLMFNKILAEDLSASDLALTPPMGWNSWNCFGTDVTEKEARANADFMAAKLRAHGWKYIVIDMGWYLPPEITVGTFKQPKPSQAIDGYGRLVPDLKKFPSAAAGMGFKHFADELHRKGLKFGIHIMRGIPWQAVEKNTPIAGSRFTAQDAADPTDACEWYHGMLGLKAATPAGRDYYRSIVKLYSEWGVDFIKMDDTSRPYHTADIEAVHAAIVECGRPIVLSLSPGASPLSEAAHLEANANQWRISQDFWDMWPPLKKQFELCREWAPYVHPGHWPDCDMIPLGKLRVTGSDDYVAGLMGKQPSEITDEYSHLTHDEARTLVTLWCVFRSPLIFGGNLPETDPFTISLITNDEVLAVDQLGHGARELESKDGGVIWSAELPDASEKIVALFNLNDRRRQKITVNFQELGLGPGQYSVRDLWQKRDLGRFATKFSSTIPPHGAAIFKLWAGE